MTADVNLVAILFNGMCANPKRVDDIISLWIDTYRGFCDMNSCISAFVHDIYHAEVKFSFESKGELRLFDLGRLAIHVSFLTANETVILKAIVDRHRQYFKSTKMINMDDHGGEISDIDVANLVFFDCLVDAELNQTFSRDLFVSRVFTLLLEVARGTERDHVHAFFESTFLVISRMLMNFKKRHRRNRKFVFKHADETLKYGVFSIIHQTWDRHVDFLPPENRNHIIRHFLKIT